MGHTEDIIAEVNKMAGKYSAYEVFTDWIRMTAICISNATQPVHSRLWENREALYLDTARRYAPEEVESFCRMTGMLTKALEENMQDVLGLVYMKSGMGSAAAGQFFTPPHVQELLADLMIQRRGDGRYSIYEPSCGSGGMIIAAASTLKKQDESFQNRLYVVAQDIDLKGVYMTYIQLSLLGIKAVCIQGNSLGKKDIWAIPKENKYYTPAWMGICL